MRIVDGISQKAFSEALAGRAGLTASHAKRYGSHEPNLDVAVAAGLSDCLSEWLQTGVSADGSERPYDRKITRAPEALALVRKWLERNPPGIEILDDTVFLFIGLAAEFVGQRYPAKGMVQAAEDRVAAIFFSFLDSEWRSHVYLCKGCNCYYFLDRAPRKMYTRGMHCVKCAPIATAKHSTRESRQKRDAARISHAVRAFRLESKRFYAPDAEAVATLINKALGIKKQGWHVTKNWVTRHREEITALASQEASSAKS